MEEQNSMNNEEILALLKEEWPAHCAALGDEYLTDIIKEPGCEVASIKGGAEFDYLGYVEILTVSVTLIREILETVQKFQAQHRRPPLRREIRLSKTTIERKEKLPPSVAARLLKLFEKVLEQLKIKDQ